MEPIPGRGALEDPYFDPHFSESIERFGLVFALAANGRPINEDANLDTPVMSGE